MKIGSFVIALLILGFSVNGAFAQEVTSTVSVDSPSVEAPAHESAPIVEPTDDVDESPIIDTPAADVEPSKEIPIEPVTPVDPATPVAEEGTPTVSGSHDGIVVIVVDPVDPVDPLPPIASGDGHVSVGPSISTGTKTPTEPKCSIPIDGSPSDCDEVPPIDPIGPIADCAAEADGPFTPVDCNLVGHNGPATNAPAVDPAIKDSNCKIEQVDDHTFITVCTPSDNDDGTDGGNSETNPTNDGGANTTTNDADETTGGGSMFFSSWNQPSTFSAAPAPTPAPAPAAEGTNGGNTGGTVEAAPVANDGTTPSLAADTTPVATNTGLITGANAPLIGLLALLVIGGVLYVRSRKA